MKLRKNYFLIFLTYFIIIFPMNAAYYGFQYREFGATDSTDSSQLFGGKTYTAMENGLGAGVGGYLSLSPIEIETDNFWIEDEAYVQFAGLYLVKKIYYGGFFDLTFIPSLFYGRGNMMVNRINNYTDKTILEDNSTFTIVEPGISIEFSITSAVRIESSFSISSLSGTDLENYEDNDFGGYTITFSVITGSSPFDYTLGRERSSAVESSLHRN